MKIVKPIVWGEDLPAQLVIKNGKLETVDGSPLDFTGIPDGTVVNVVPHNELKTIVNEWQLLSRIGA